MKKRKSGYFDFRYMNGAPPEVTELALQEKLTNQQVKKLRNMTKIVHVMTEANIQSLTAYVEKHGGKSNGSNGGRIRRPKKVRKTA